MPARHRELLAAMGVNQLTVTKHPEGSLLVFPRPAWELFRDRVAALPMDSSGWKRVFLGKSADRNQSRVPDGHVFLGNAMDVEIDASSRVLIAPELRASAGLVRDVMLLGMGSHFELWDAERHAAHEAEVMRSPMPDSLKNFSF